MTNEAAVKMTAEITVDTLKFMAQQEGITLEQVIVLLSQKHAGTVRRFNALMNVAKEYVAKA